MTLPTSKQLKIGGLVILAIPIVILLAFSVGEVAYGGISGLQHLGQLAALAFLAWVAWRRPFWGGVALIALALVLTGLYLLFVHGFPPSTVTLTVVVLFIPPVISGSLFILAARQERDMGDRMPAARP